MNRSAIPGMPKYFLAPLLLAAALSAALYAEFAHKATPKQFSPVTQGDDTLLRAIPEDRLTGPLPKNLASFKTAADTLSCAPGLCQTIQAPGPLEGEGIEVSRHSVRFKADTQQSQLNCDEGASSDPACSVGDLTIAGEQFYVFGDGCLYVRQLANAYFAITKKYCQGDNGLLQRVHQTLYAVGVDLIARKSIPAKRTTSSTKVLFQVPRGAKFTVVAAEVDESEDFYATPTRYLIRNSTGTLGWTTPEYVGTEQCGSTDASQLCFHGD